MPLKKQNMLKSHEQHAGELFLQHMRGSPPDQSQHLLHMVGDAMSPQHSLFFARLNYFPLGALDGQGRPWATLLCSPELVIVSADELRISAALPAGKLCTVM